MLSASRVSIAFADACEAEVRALGGSEMVLYDLRQACNQVIADAHRLDNSMASRETLRRDVFALVSLLSGIVQSRTATLIGAEVGPDGD